MNTNILCRVGIYNDTDDPANDCAAIGISNPDPTKDGAPSRGMVRVFHSGGVAFDFQRLVLGLDESARPPRWILAPPDETVDDHIPF